ncbi:hypothetical protein [Granulicella paludicola]|uniref:hypothetical protein n=1 Tax=Granulicella paludicola TaxID=474951 RepID=UPI0021DFACF5|nr:hypothetical protein [Granulicella paludicola]
MFWGKSSATRNEGDEQQQLIGVFEHAGAGELFTLDDITERLHSMRRDRVAYWLGELAARRVIDQFVTVISPATNGGIDRFDRLDQVPTEIFDPFQLKDIEVGPGSVRVYFTKHQEATERA